MAGETQITVVGNLVADPELRTVGNGNTVCDFRIASTPRTYNRQTQQFEDGQALFLSCSAWDSQYQTMASNIKASLSKGMRVIVQGNLTSRSYTAQDGSQRTVFEIRVTEIGPALSRNTAVVTRAGGSGNYNGGGYNAGNSGNGYNGGYNGGANAQRGGYSGGARGGYNGGYGNAQAAQPAQAAPTAPAAQPAPSQDVWGVESQGAQSFGSFGSAGSQSSDDGGDEFGGDDVTF
ncbi:MAG: single-stranded DNA-binding protein [Bifidobacteriaceae bacterium]|nr:single-stranded DNA-binding protein [Bifidobacteriaceae bacterium]